MDQAKLFFRKKLLFDIDCFSPELIAQVMHAYTSNGLIDLKRIFVEAMATKDADDGSSQPALLNAGTVRATCLPEALKHMQAQQSPEYIESMIVSKCCERLSHGAKHTNLYKFFRDRSDDPRFLSRKNMLNILHSFDILLDKKAFDAFFNKHDCGSGTIETLEFLKKLFPAQDVESNAFVPEQTYVPRPNLQFQDIVPRPVSSSFSAAPDRQRSVEDLLERLRQKRQALETATYAPPHSAASSPRPASAAAVLGRGARPGATPVVVNVPNLFGKPPESPLSGSGRSAHRSRPSSRGVSAGETRAWSPSPAGGRVIGFFAPTLDLFSTPHAELAIQSARDGGHAVAAARPTSAPASGGTLHTGARFAQPPQQRTGSRSRKRGTSAASDDFGFQELRVSQLSPRAPVLSLAAPEPMLFDEALQDIMQSSLQKALLELTDSPRVSPVQSLNTTDRPHSRSRPASASATTRPRSARTPCQAAQHRVKEGNIFTEESANATIHTSRAIPETPSSVPSFVNKEPIVLVTQIKQELRVQRPASAPVSRAKGSPRFQKLSPSSVAGPATTPSTDSASHSAEPRVPMLNMPNSVGPERQQRPKTSARSARRPTRPVDIPVHTNYVLDPSYVDATDSLVFPEGPRLTAPSPSPSPRSAHSTRTFDTAATFTSVNTKSPVYTGQTRTNRVDPTSPQLSSQYRLYKNYSRTSNNEYGMFSTLYLKAVRKNNRLFEKKIRSRSPIFAEGKSG